MGTDQKPTRRLGVNKDVFFTEFAVTQKPWGYQGCSDTDLDLRFTIYGFHYKFTECADPYFFKKMET